MPNTQQLQQEANRFSATPPAWFAIFAHSRYEKKIAETLRKREIETFLPTYRVKRTWQNRQRVTIDIPLFPSYLFAKFAPRQRSSILGVPGVLSIVGQEKSSVLPDHYIAKLRTGVQLQRIYPHPGVAVGDRVSIIAGPMAGIDGVLAHVRSEFRVVVSVAMVQQSIAIEVSRDEIEVLHGPERPSRLGVPAEVWR